MILQVFSIFDVKLGAYATPFFRVNSAIAEREFSDLCRDSRSPISQHPEDYLLCRLGSFNDADGLMVSESVEHICTASQYALKADDGNTK